MPRFSKIPVMRMHFPYHLTLSTMFSACAETRFPRRQSLNVIANIGNKYAANFRHDCALNGIRQKMSGVTSARINPSAALSL